MDSRDDADEQRERLVLWLRRRDPAQPITTVETHISILAFQGDRVYKIRKNVVFPFIDLSTPEARAADCERELALNRAMAPDVYLGIELVTEDDTVVESALVMRRMPDARRLASLVRPGAADATDCIDRLAALIARFHGRAATGGEVDRAASHDAVTRLWERQIAQCAPYEGAAFPAPMAGEVAALARRYLSGRRALFEARIAAGRARDGHGDLLADDVFCLPDGPRVLDRLEFDDQLRYGDTLLDVAFLAMDLERLGRGDLARRFLDEYRDHAEDDWPPSLEHFYIAYRAHVRAKIAALGDDRRRVRQLLSMSRDHLDAGRIRLVLVGGPPATGKTTVAGAIGRTTAWPVLRSDVLRKELAGVDPLADARAPVDEGLYEPAGRNATYAALCERARELLSIGHSVVLDASWGDPAWRAAAARVAAESSSDLVALCCRTSLDEAIARAVSRTLARADASDADTEATIALYTRFAPWPEATALDTTTSTPDQVAALALETVGSH